MQIPETPLTVEQLDLMRQLDAYANGHASFYPDGSALGPSVQAACKTLYSNLLQMTRMLAPILDRTTAREMRTFTLHDEGHALKVAHLMWHILSQERRGRLTPPEIGILIGAAYLHDLGMALDDEERTKRLEPASDLWDLLELDEAQKKAMDALRKKASDPALSEPARMLARQRLYQAEEALLCQDTRDRHATPQRYEELLDKLCQFHREDPARIPDPETCLTFDGNSFQSKLIDVCVSHNKDTDVLVESDPSNSQRPRFPADYPVGATSADLHMAAAALRLADILDFDRERTPAVLFHYLLPGTLSSDDRSLIEWGKHLAISNWHIEEETVVFRGRCTDHVVHHAIVQFSSLIQREIEVTRATFRATHGDSWPFVLPDVVKADIHEEGYHYVPYRFELDDERIYELLMGGAIYDTPLAAVRELIQNAVDSCKLRDALDQLYEPHRRPDTTERITIRFEEPTDESPVAKLTVSDTGTGMDRWILEQYFLKVGRSFYRSSEFAQCRLQLRKAGGEIDFAPVSEFGIGFLSCFLLADRIEVETAMLESPRGDTRKRNLIIDGPTRLIRISEEENKGARRLKGTRITLIMSPKRPSEHPWSELIAYLEDICQDLPYRLNLIHVSDGEEHRATIDARPLTVELPPENEAFAYRIPVHDEVIGLHGEIALINEFLRAEAERALAQAAPAVVVESGRRFYGDNSVLLRGGFNVGNVPGLPQGSEAKIRLTWETRESRRYVSTDLSRNSTTHQRSIAQKVIRAWLTHLIENSDDLPEGLVAGLEVEYPALGMDLWWISRATWGFSFVDCPWLEDYDALTVYRLARQGWKTVTDIRYEEEDILSAWEDAEVKEIYLSSELVTSVYRLLLASILPRICRPRVSVLESYESGYLVTSPEPGWRKVLSQWHTFLSEPVTWGPFAEYVGTGIEDLLYYGNLTERSFLNLNFRERLAVLSDDEPHNLPRIFDRLFQFRRGERARLNPEQANLLQKVIDLAGDLEIADISIGPPHQLDSFSLE